MKVIINFHGARVCAFLGKSNNYVGETETQGQTLREGLQLASDVKQETGGRKYVGWKQ